MPVAKLDANHCNGENFDVITESVTCRLVRFAIQNDETNYAVKCVWGAWGIAGGSAGSRFLTPKRMTKTGHGR